jgi:hypothetical protein
MDAVFVNWNIVKKKCWTFMLQPINNRYWVVIIFFIHHLIRHRFRSVSQHFVFRWWSVEDAWQLLRHVLCVLTVWVSAFPTWSAVLIECSSIIEWRLWPHLQYLVLYVSEFIPLHSDPSKYPSICIMDLNFICKIWILCSSVLFGICLLM